MSFETVAYAVAVYCLLSSTVCMFSGLARPEAEGSFVAAGLLASFLLMAAFNMLAVEDERLRAEYQSCINHELLIVESTHDEASTACHASNRSAN